MSGPTTVIFTADPGVVLLAASAILAARAVQQGYADADALRERHDAARDAQQQAQNAARQQGELATRSRIEAAQEQHARLAALCATLRLPATPPPAADADPGVYLQQLAEANRALELALRRHAEALQAKEPEDALALAGELLAASAPSATPAASPAFTAPPLPPTGQAAVDRLLERLRCLASPPPTLRALAEELAHTRHAERAELLANELRRQIQLELEQAQQRQLLEAQAIVLEQSLHDLGYQVEPIGETLFVEGGVVHFSRAGWGDHQVRLRVAAGGQGANFNVVRAIDADNREQERSVLDHLAEDRWCAEFPALLHALAQRGLRMNVTRRLAAGELPVQLVNRDLLPRFAAEETPLAPKLRHRGHAPGRS